MSDKPCSWFSVLTSRIHGIGSLVLLCLKLHWHPAAPRQKTLSHVADCLSSSTQKKHHMDMHINHSSPSQKGICLSYSLTWKTNEIFVLRSPYVSKISHSCKHPVSGRLARLCLHATDGESVTVPLSLKVTVLSQDHKRAVIHFFCSCESVV